MNTTAKSFDWVLGRREVLKVVGAGFIAGVAGSVRAQGQATQRAKRVIVAGGGIGGLCCAYELMKRGHDVTLLEASGRAGGHVRTIHDPLPDGLYADVGAEHFTNPGYDRYRTYVEEFQLPVLKYPRRIDMLRRIDNQWYTEEQLHDRTVLQGFGFNAREIDYIVERGWPELPLLYLGPYLDDFPDEYQPFGVGHDKLDEISAGELLARDGATDAALRFSGVRRGDGSPAARVGQVSALFRLWQTAILKHRRLPVFKREVFRIQGGNQVLTDTFSARLGERVRLGCPVTAIEHGANSVTVRFTEHAEPRTIEAEYLVCSLPLAILKKIPVTPDWPAPKRFVIDNVQIGSQSRVVLQSRTPFWKGDLPSINLETGDSSMYLVYETADEVPGDRSVLMGSGKPDVTAAEAEAAFRGLYPGKKPITIEQTLVKNWAQDPWAPGCERYPYPLGQLHQFWPQMITSVGRIHFSSCHSDNLPWGMDAATRSAFRVASTIDQAM